MCYVTVLHTCICACCVHEHLCCCENGVELVMQHICAALLLLPYAAVVRGSEGSTCRYNYKLPRYNQMMNALTWMSHSQNLRRMAQEYVIDLCAPFHQLAACLPRAVPHTPRYGQALLCRVSCHHGSAHAEQFGPETVTLHGMKSAPAPGHADDPSYAQSWPAGCRYLRPPVTRFRLMDFHFMDRIVRDSNRHASSFAPCLDTASSRGRHCKHYVQQPLGRPEL